MKRLFVCSQGQVRSPAAASLYPGSEFLGIHNRYTSMEDVRMQSRKADVIYCMDETHMQAYLRDYPEFLPKIKILNLPDMFSGPSAFLKEVIKEKVARWER